MTVHLPYFIIKAMLHGFTVEFITNEQRGTLREYLSLDACRLFASQAYTAPFSSSGMRTKGLQIKS